MNKESYFKKSGQSGLPNRCPILDYCERHALTIYFFSEYKKSNNFDSYLKTLVKEGVIPFDFEENVIPIISEQPTWLKGKANGMFTNMCPEVNLFDRENRLIFSEEVSCSSGKWDLELKTSPKFEVWEDKHYSECLEFSKYLFENKFTGPKKSGKVSSETCYTYLMLDKRTGYHKIGISSNPKHREKTLQSEQPEIITISKRKFIKRKFALEMEKELHELYSDLKVRGEWFNLKQSDVYSIRKKMED